MFISFVIPVYNGKNTIISCLESIESQMNAEDEFEIIVVDDCSTDETREIVNDYAKTHIHVRLLCQLQNHRQGAARNRGVKEAKGEYITFIDADDLVLDGILEAIRVARKTQADLVFGYMEIENEEGTSIHKISEDVSGIMTGVQFAERFCSDGVFYYPPSFLYKRSFMEQINNPFVEDRQHEDRDWLASVLAQAKSVSVCSKTTYRYKLNPTSTCRNPKYSTVFDHVASGIRHIDLSKQLQSDCPKMSATLFAFGVEEIHHSIRLRNLTKYSWSDNRHLCDSQHLRPLMPDLKRICRNYKMPWEVRSVTYVPIMTMMMTLFGGPIARIIRKMKCCDCHE